jgi:replicative DNA helicase
VDYLQLLSGTNARANRVAEITEITTALKSLAKELDIPVLALSQLSRQVEQRDDKRPQLSDLRESGSIEQDADIVMFVFREEYYIARREPKDGTPAHAEWESELRRAAGKAEILIEKQRQGPTGTVHLRFDARLTKFSDPGDDAHAMEAA